MRSLQFVRKFLIWVDYLGQCIDNGWWVVTNGSGCGGYMSVIQSLCRVWKEREHNVSLGGSAEWNLEVKATHQLLPLKQQHPLPHLPITTIITTIINHPMVSLTICVIRSSVKRVSNHILMVLNVSHLSLEWMFLVELF